MMNNDNSSTKKIIGALVALAIPILIIILVLCIFITLFVVFFSIAQDEEGEVYDRRNVISVVMSANEIPNSYKNSITYFGENNGSGKTNAIEYGISSVNIIKTGLDEYEFPYEVKSWIEFNADNYDTALNNAVAEWADDHDGEAPGQVSYNPWPWVSTAHDDVQKVLDYFDVSGTDDETEKQSRMQKAAKASAWLISYYSYNDYDIASMTAKERRSGVFVMTGLSVEDYCAAFTDYELSVDDTASIQAYKTALAQSASKPKGETEDEAEDTSGQDGAETSEPTVSDPSVSNLVDVMKDVKGLTSGIVIDQFLNIIENPEIESEDGETKSVMSVLDRVITCLDHGQANAELDVFLNNGSTGSFSIGSQEAQSMWDVINNNGSGGAVYNCTAFTDYCFYVVYGKHYGGGDGKNVVSNTAAAYPDEFEVSDTPKSNSIFSEPATPSNQYGHVGWVNEVWDENGQTMIRYSEGNITINGQSGGIVCNKVETLDAFLNTSYRGKPITFCVPIN